MLITFLKPFKDYKVGTVLDLDTTDRLVFEFIIKRDNLDKEEIIKNFCQKTITKKEKKKLRSEYYKDYYVKNKKEIIEYKQKWSEENRQRANEIKYKWAAKNLEKKRKSALDWYHRNKEKLKEKRNAQN